MTQRLLAAFLLFLFLLAGCSGNQTLKLSAEAKNSVEKVAKIYGEQNPKIIDVKTTEEETTKKAMYIVSIQGNFQNGEKKSNKLHFSITEDGKRVWALTFDSWQENEVDVTK